MPTVLIDCSCPLSVHSSTFFALLIMNETSAAPLGSIQFLLVWLLSAIALSALSGRWQLVAVVLVGIGGGAAFSLFFTVVCHPGELARSILLAACATISAVLCLLPIPPIRHGALRSAAAWLGALGIIISISILSGASDWANVWARLWVSWNPAWGTGIEDGLSAAFVCLAIVGMAVDWLLKRQFGECPDEVCCFRSFLCPLQLLSIFGRNGITILQTTQQIYPMHTIAQDISLLRYRSGRSCSVLNRRIRFCSHRTKHFCRHTTHCLRPHTKLESFTPRATSHDPGVGIAFSL